MRPRRQQVVFANLIGGLWTKVSADAGYKGPFADGGDVTDVLVNTMPQHSIQPTVNANGSENTRVRGMKEPSQLIPTVV